MEALFENYASPIIDWAPVMAYAILFAYYVHHNLIRHLALSG